MSPEQPFNYQEHINFAAQRAYALLDKKKLPEAIDSMVSDATNDPTINEMLKMSIIDMGLALRSDPELNEEKVVKFIEGFSGAPKRQFNGRFPSVNHPKPTVGQLVINPVDTLKKDESIPRVKESLKSEKATPASETPESILEGLKTQVEQATAENTELLGRIRERYLRLLKTVQDKKSPVYQEIIAAKRQFDGLFPSVNHPKPVVEQPVVNPIDTLKSDESIPLKDRETFLEYYAQLPTPLQERFQKRLVNVLKNGKNEAGLITALRGASFEMSRLATIVRQGLETVDLSNVEKIPPFSYTGFEKPKVEGPVDYENIRLKEFTKVVIDLDVPIKRGEQTRVYETKSYPRMKYGADVQARNQLLKYQAAIDQGLVEGASVEIRGRVDKAFLGWLMGERVGDFGAVPGVEVIYTFELPSGKEYRFVIKRAEHKQGLKFKNEERYDEGDHLVIQGIQQSIADKRIIGIIGDVHINPSLASEELRPFLDDPMQITSRVLFEEYDRLQRDAMTKKLLDISEGAKINKDNRKSAANPEYANPSFIRQLIEEYQGFLRENPAVAAVKGAYQLATEKIPLAVERTMAVITKIGQFEQDRAQSDEESVLREQRKSMGYSGRPEGVSLDVDHIMLDVMYSMNKEGFDEAAATRAVGKEQLDLFFTNHPTESGVRVFRYRSQQELDAAVMADASLRSVYEQMPRRYRDGLSKLFKEGEFVRSYDWPERFQKVEEIPELLKGQDRRYQEIQMYDPLGGEKKFTKQSDTNEDAIERVKTMILKDNIQRARDYIASDPKRSGAYRRDIEQISGRLSALELERDAKLIELQKECKEKSQPIVKELGALKTRRNQQAGAGATAEELKDADEAIRTQSALKDEVFSALRKASEEYQKKILVTYEELEQTYHKIIPTNEWETFARSITKEIDQNIIKFIYAVTADGRVVVQEEVLRGEVTGRAAHSELAQGRNVYGAGEVAFEKQDGNWMLVEINNGSGHYRPEGSSSLPYVKKLVEDKGIDTTNVTLVDSILRGAPLREAALF